MTGLWCRWKDEYGMNFGRETTAKSMAKKSVKEPGKCI